MDHTATVPPTNQIPDWTADPRTGTPNQSAVFFAAASDVESILLANGYRLLNGQVYTVARLIVAQLAHVHHLAPLGEGQPLD